jgi:5-methylcytosine-specific restriction protein B
VQYFSIPTIKSSIERLQEIKANWLLPAFVFAANDVGTDGLPENED